MADLLRTLRGGGAGRARPGGQGDGGAAPGRGAGDGRGTRAVVASIFAVFVTWFRVHGISRDFPLLGDQVRDWAIALGPFSQLPLVGPPSTAGGHTLGPIYYWLIWISRVGIGPFVDNLPHAGGIGLSLLQSAADVVLLGALWARLGGPLALATCLLIATSPFDAAVTASVWNPQVAVAFTKISLALVLRWDGTQSRLRALLIAATAWLAVQAHSTAIFFAAAVFAWLVAREIARKRIAAGCWAAYDVVTTVLVLQIPFFLHHVRGAAAAGGPAGAVGAAASVASGESPLRLWDSATNLARTIGLTLLEPAHAGWAWLVLLAAAGAVVARGKRVGLATVFVTVVPLAIAILGYAILPRQNDYWYLVLAPSAAAMVATAAGTLGPWRVRQAVAWVALLAIVAAIPARYAFSRKLNRLPEYGMLVAASRQIVRNGVALRSLDAPFLPLTTEPGYLVTVLGGKFDPASPVAAEILRDGRVVYREVRP